MDGVAREAAGRSGCCRCLPMLSYVSKAACCSSNKPFSSKLRSTDRPRNNLGTSQEHSITTSAILYGLLMFISYYLNNFYDSSIFNVLTNLLQRDRSPSSSSFSSCCLLTRNNSTSTEHTQISELGSTAASLRLSAQRRRISIYLTMSGGK